MSRQKKKKKDDTKDNSGGIGSGLKNLIIASAVAFGLCFGCDDGATDSVLQLDIGTHAGADA